MPLPDERAASAGALFEQLGEEGFRVLAIAWRGWCRDHDRAVAGTRASSSLPVRGLPGPAQGERRERPSGAGGERGRGQDPDRRQRAGHAPRLRRARLAVTGVITGDELAAHERRGAARARSHRSTCSAGSRRSRRSACILASSGPASGRLSRRRDQRRLGAARGRCRHLGRQRRRRRQGGRRPGPARARPRGGPRGVLEGRRTVETSPNTL